MFGSAWESLTSYNGTKINDEKCQFVTLLVIAVAGDTANKSSLGADETFMGC